MSKFLLQVGLGPTTLAPLLRSPARETALNRKWRHSNFDFDRQCARPRAQILLFGSFHTGGPSFNPRFPDSWFIVDPKHGRPTCGQCWCNWCVRTEDSPPARE